ncbi:lipopolysaccharide/colanic/teichoic acid biosynthesis glycosyltransferase [Altererythrobacter atlanticus]|nr:sugar transferase [Croceibacterium atlanticum]MBB5731583.1 lipopolysaccharide/colanic/teichoic acid biosynthesis glycosyltransferase [Croceibacterium atlanticum]
MDCSDRSSARGRRDYVAADPIEGRMIDIVGALALILLFAPLMLLIAIAVFVADPGPILFRQSRIGRDGRMFKCLKFRTMATDAEARLASLLKNDPAARAEWERDHKLRVDPRIVGIGRFLRRSSLDELPQLFNVLLGEMSLVGPRPIVEAEACRYGKYLIYYCAVRPGITGLWQISGRNDVHYRRRVAFDVVYARKCRVSDNLRIMFLTVPCVLTARGSY